MNFAKASALCADGALIRRSLWDSYVTRTPEGGMRFVLPASLKKKLSEKYQPTKTDLAANDWEVQRAVAKLSERQAYGVGK